MFRSIIILSAILIFSCKAKDPDQQVSTTVIEESSSVNKWADIFNGKDLKGWSTKIKGHPLNENFGNTFRAKDGILSIRYDEYGDNFDGRFGAIYYDKKLSDYRLKVEYRFVGETAPGAPEWGFRDSGVQFHSQSPGSLDIDQPFPVCLEYNLHGGNGKDERPVGAICANGMFIEIDGKQNESYCTPPAIKKTFHGDQWVTLEIDVKDGVISHFVNGEEILTYSNPTLNPENEIAKTMMKNGNTKVSDGYISLQSNSHPIDFRKIEIIEY